VKSSKVNRYRSGIRNPWQEVQVYRDKEKIKVYVIDWRTAKVTTLEAKIKDPKAKPYAG